MSGDNGPKEIVSASSFFLFLSEEEISALDLADQEPPIIVKPGKPDLLVAAKNSSVSIGLKNLVPNDFNDPSFVEFPEGTGKKRFVYGLRDSTKRLKFVGISVEGVGKALLQVPDGADWEIVIHYA